MDMTSDDVSGIDTFKIKAKARALMDPGETIQWMGASSSTAFMPGQVAIVAIGAFSCYMLSSRTLTSLMQGDTEGVGVFGVICLLASAAIAYWVLAPVVRNLSVAWVVTDRHVFRFAGKHIDATDLRYAVAIETRPRQGRRGDVTVTLPPVMTASGDAKRQTVLMLDVDDMPSAYEAVRRANTQGA